MRSILKKINAHLFFMLVLIIICAISCQQSHDTKAFDYGTKSDSALYYFNQGWEQIMDKGEWTNAETSFRKSITFDPNFLIGKSLVGRITQNLDERIQLKQELESQKETATSEERLLLDVYLLNIEIMNMRNQATQEEAREITQKFQSLSESNFRKFVHIFPEESYVKAEYIEVLRSVYGAKPTLDSLKNLVNETQKDIPFFARYSASLETELGNFEQALLQAKHLKEITSEASPSPEVLFAEIYFKMDSLRLAKKHIERALQIDPNHLIAQRWKQGIDQTIAARNTTGE